MKQLYICVICFLLGINQFFAQQTPLDFSNSLQTFTAFGGSQFSFGVDQTDANNPVGQFFNDGSQEWQGFFIDLSNPIDLSEQQIITLSFYQFDPNAHTIMLKLENGSEADVEVVQSNSGSGWSYDLTFDFSDATLSGVGTPVNAMGVYNRLVLFIDGGALIPGTYLIDDINDGSVATDPNEIDVVYTDLVWSDEFDSDGAVDDTKWFHQTQLPAGGNWFNGEQQHYTNRIENSFVESGFLNIVAIKENFTDQGETKQYTSARLNSKFAFTYGRVDVRAKLPEGDGTWPAIWTLGKNINEAGAYWQTQGFGTTPWPDCGEIDIMEHGLGPVNHVSSAIHTPSSFGATVNFQSYILNDVANDFHVYSMNWSPNQITFLIDGVGFYTYNPAVKDASTWPFDEDQYLLLNIAMGGVAGSIDPSFTQSEMVIDYVRVYQNSPLSIDDLNKDEIRVYPNPAREVITIKTDSDIENLKLYNSLGQIVIDQNTKTKTMDISQLQNGVYILKIKSKNRTVTKRILVD
jgi:beta-glucanase (GH16 family)